MVLYNPNTDSIYFCEIHPKLIQNTDLCKIFFFN